MKEKDLMIHKGDGVNNELFLSLFLGVLFAIPVYIICSLVIPEDAVIITFFSGWLFGICIYVWFLIYQRNMNKKYDKAEKGIKSPVFYKTNGNFDLGNRGRNGNIYFCEAGIVFISLDAKPHMIEEVLITNILKYEFDNIHMNIYTKDEKVFLITLPDADRVLNILKEKGWVV